ncbi:MAG: hypothetical protein A2161_20985 [Candidatus Schekmanbacteria bacterium RBG_13_48_7]|uniref:RNA polymerase subunit sigma-24 n=1 Tax=Candidatus Schekmanbacteria bacterium RBG_13_48_7 TaxID=1817878 RepID=A0A1F7RSX0_9BACT|nr:MAG: hypothetical protein A2161_20985 [Candidatus Schekmanbacteria bacterium RBG_13_48_7]
MVDLREKSEKELVKQFLEGNQVAFNELVIRCKKKVYYMARRYTFSHEYADDVSQEVFITLYTSAHMYNDYYPFLPWLLKITVNKSINYMKKMKPHRNHSYLDEIKVDNENPDIIRSNPDPGSISENEELSHALHNAVETLKPKYRTVFSLAMMEGMSYKEIAEILNISMGTVMSRLNRARNQLKKVLYPYFKGI